MGIISAWFKRLVSFPFRFVSRFSTSRNEGLTASTPTRTSTRSCRKRLPSTKSCAPRLKKTLENKCGTEVEKIIGKRTHRGKVEYLVKWVGCGNEANQWCAVGKLNCGRLITEFEKNQAGKEEVTHPEKLSSSLVLGLNLRQLRVELKKRRLSPSGLKPQLLQRLWAATQATPYPEESTDLHADISSSLAKNRLAFSARRKKQKSSAAAKANASPTQLPSSVDNDRQPPADNNNDMGLRPFSIDLDSTNLSGNVKRKGVSELNEEEEVFQSKKPREIPPNVCQSCHAYKSSEEVLTKCMYCSTVFCRHSAHDNSAYSNYTRDLPFFKCTTCQTTKESFGSICYVQPSETDNLPAVVFQQTTLLPSPATQLLSDMFTTQLLNKQTVALLLPDDEDSLKAYIMSSDKRSAKNKFTTHIIAGLDDLLPRLHKSQIVVMHYCLKLQGNQFTGILPITTPSQVNNCNLQVVFISRKTGRDGPAKVRMDFFLDPVVLRSLVPAEKSRVKHLQQLTEDYIQFKWQHDSLQLTPVRNCVQMELLKRVENVTFQNRTYQKTEWFLASEDYLNLKSQVFSGEVEIDSVKVVPIGFITITDFFTEEELSQLEDSVYELEQSKEYEEQLPMTKQATTVHQAISRTKYFFEARYGWGENANDAAALRTNGIQTDVDKVPQWVKSVAEAPLVEAGIVKEAFFNQYSINIYHDGKTGLLSHFDDASRFERPILSVRLFSASRLCFGGSGYGYSNALFFVPLPRGCVALMGPGYSSDTVKHGIRPCDLNGKSASIILRRVHPLLLQKAAAAAAARK